MCWEGGSTIAVLLLLDLFFATPKEFQNVALFLPSGLPSTLTRHEKNNFAKALFKPEGFENVGFSMTSRWRDAISLSKFSSNINSKLPLIFTL